MSHQRQRPSLAYLLRRLFCGCCDSDRVIIRCIDLSHSLLTEVPTEVYICERTLENLRLDSNHIVELPRQLFNCDELRVLSVSDNELNFIPPAISFLQNLQRLDISKNAVTTLPDNIRQCTSLTYLDVSINPLEKLPEGLVNIVSLQELYLTDVYLEFLPANFGKLVNLRILELRENSLVTLPKTMNRLIHLNRLDIGFNEFQELPEVVCSLNNLTELWIDGNHIKKLSPSIGHLRKMIHFDASHNNLEYLPRDVGYWTRVQEFNVSNNELLSLPSTMGNMKNLIGLKLEENSLKALPDAIGKLTHLEELMLTHNYLSHLPGSIGLLRRLKVLTVDKNYLSDIPSELGSCTSLSILSLRGNRLYEIPAEVGHLSSLRVLNLVDNLIKFLPMSVLKLEKLSALWLSNNQSQPLMPLQQERDPDTNKNVLTCFMLPQQRKQSVPGPSTSTDEVRHTPRVAPRHIYFAPNTGVPLEQPGRLTRAPTPYPKELRALAKHAKHVQKTLSVSQQRPGETVAHPVQGPLEIKEATVKIKSGTGTTLSSSIALNEPTPQPVETLTESLVSLVLQSTEILDTERTPESSVSSLPVAYESSPIIREAKNIRTDSQTGPGVCSPTPQVITVAPAPTKETKVPPPYHIAAAYSVKAQFFNPTEYTLPESASTSHSACSPVLSADDRSEQRRSSTHRTVSPATSSGGRSEKSTRRPYAGRESFPYPADRFERSETHRIASPGMSAGDRSNLQGTHRSSMVSVVSPVMSSDDSAEQKNSQSHFALETAVPKSDEKSASQPTPCISEHSDPSTHSLGAYVTQIQYSSSEGRGTASPGPDAAECSEQQSARSLSAYVVQPSVHEIDKYAIRRSDDAGEQMSTRNFSAYTIRTPHRTSVPVHDIDQYTIMEQSDSSYANVERTASTYAVRSTISEPESASVLISDGRSEPEIVTSSAPLSSGEVRLPHTYNVETSSTASSGEIRITKCSHSADIYPGMSTSSSFLPVVPQSTYALQGYIPEDIGVPSCDRSKGSYSTRGPFINLNEFVSGSGTVTASSELRSSAAVSSYEPSDSSSRSEPSSRVNFHLSTPPLGTLGNSAHSLSTIVEHNGSQSGSGAIIQSVECDMAHQSDDSDSVARFTLKTVFTASEERGQHNSRSSDIYSAHVVYPNPAEYSLPESSNTSHSTQSIRPTPQSLSVHSAQLFHQALSPHQSLSAHSIHLPHQILSTHSSQSSYRPLSPRSAQSAHDTLSTHSVESLHQPLSAHSIQSLHQPLSTHSSQLFYQHQSPHSVLSGLSNLSGLSGYSGHLSHSVHAPYSIHSSHSVHSAHSVQSIETIDISAMEPGDSQRSNLNETFTRTLHPCAAVDNDDMTSSNHDSNFNPEDNKPRFFVQDKPAPGQNIVAPTPKRPNTVDKASRIPYLTSPSMGRSPRFASTSQFESITVSPRSCRRDFSVREVKSDTSIVSDASGVQRTKIPGPNSKPVSPERDRIKKWVFGQHKNATVMNVLIQKNPDLGFSIINVPGKGIFIDDVKNQDLLSVGDKILEVEGIDVTVLNKDEVMEILLAAGKNICMMISHI